MDTKRYILQFTVTLLIIAVIVLFFLLGRSLPFDKFNLGDVFYGSKITLTSEYPNYKLDIDSSSILVSILKEYGVFTRGAYDDSGILQKVDSIKIYLVRTPPQSQLSSYWEGEDGDEPVMVMNGNYGINDGDLIINVYLNPEKVLPEADLRNSMFSEEIIRQLYLATREKNAEFSQEKLIEEINHKLTDSKYVVMVKDETD